MKKLILTSALALLFTGLSALSAQNRQEEYLGLPGDNLNLYAVMNLFQESETLEAFERSLNDPNGMINNLDLNGDNYVDYLMVFDYADGDIHNIVLRVALNQNEFQDVAVFTVQKFRDGSVQVQLIGDEALYGPNYIIEPIYAETPNPGYKGNVVQQNQGVQQKNVTAVRTTYHEVAYWPVVTYIYRPTYVVYRSSWYWGYRPVWWSPWTPHYWHYYYGYHHNWNPHYYAYYRPWHHHRCTRYRTVYYTSIRHYSPTVIVNVDSGRYRNTYNRPDSRRDGEAHFSQRHPRGTQEYTRNRQSQVQDGRQGTRNTDATQSRNNRAIEDRNTSNRNQQQRTTTTTREGVESRNNRNQEGNNNRQAVETRSNRSQNTSGNTNQRTRENTNRVNNNSTPQQNPAPPRATNTETRQENRNVRETSSPTSRNNAIANPGQQQRNNTSAPRTETRNENRSQQEARPQQRTQSAPASAPAQTRPANTSRSSGTAVERSESRGSSSRQQSSSSEGSSSRSRNNTEETGNSRSRR